jgi:hypothetical protein
VYSDRPPQPDEVALHRSGRPLPRLRRRRHRPLHPAARELVELSGLKDQMKGVTAQAREHVHRSVGHLEPRDVRSVDAVTARTLDADLIVGRIVEEFSRHVDDAKIADVRGWYRSRWVERSPTWRSARRRRIGSGSSPRSSRSGVSSRRSPPAARAAAQARPVDAQTRQIRLATQKRFRRSVVQVLAAAVA